MRRTVVVRVAMLLALACAFGSAVPALASASNGPSFGPNVIVFDPSMPQSAIQAKLDSIATQQVPNQFGAQRYAIFFAPGTYGSSTDPLTFAAVALGLLAVALLAAYVPGRRATELDPMDALRAD